jgi:hypothetical protein
MLLGLGGAGRSTIGYLLVGEEVFSVGQEPKAEQRTFSYNQWRVRLIDTIVLKNDNPNTLVKQWAAAMLMAVDCEVGGIHAFLMCLDISGHMSKVVTDFLQSLKEPEDLKNFWPHATLVLTHAGSRANARTQEEIQDTLKALTKCQYYPGRLQSLGRKVEGRILFVEAREDREFKRRGI